jgi:hypothetical protein
MDSLNELEYLSQILDIIYNSVLYLKLHPTLYVCPYLTGNTLRLRYGPERIMLYIGLSRQYINKIITILDIIHRPVFYLKLSSYVCSYLTGNTVRLRYGPNRLMLSMVCDGWNINITVRILDIIHCPVFF